MKNLAQRVFNFFVALFLVSVFLSYWYPVLTVINFYMLFLSVVLLAADVAKTSSKDTGNVQQIGSDKVSLQDVKFLEHPITLNEFILVNYIASNRRYDLIAEFLMLRSGKLYDKNVFLNASFNECLKIYAEIVEARVKDIDTKFFLKSEDIEEFDFGEDFTDKPE